jgi:hypothetical protein
MTIAQEKASKKNKPQGEAPPSPWSAFRHRTYTVIWIASVVANIGTWMYNAGSGWLMTSLNANPLIISLVQVGERLAAFGAHYHATVSPAFHNSLVPQKRMVVNSSRSCFLKQKYQK